MADTIPGSELLARLASVADAHGVKATSIDDRTLSGTQEAITSEGCLGGRRVCHRMTCQADEASRTVRFRQAIVESSWGIPPPSLTVEKTTQQGTRGSESRTER